MSDPAYDWMILPLSENSAPEHLTIEDFFSLDRLQALQDVFAEAHSLAMVVVDMDGKQITQPSQFTELCQVLQESEKVRERCQITYKVIGETVQETGLPAYQECLNCGFIEAGIPVQAGGRQIATFLIGQNNASKVSRQRVEEFAWLMQVDVMRARNAYALMPEMPIDQFTSLVELFSRFLAESVSSTYRVYLLESELNRQRQIERELRQKGINLVYNSTSLRQILDSLSRDLHEMLNVAGEYTTNHDEVKPDVSDKQAGMLITRMLVMIRRTYRTLLDAIATEQLARSEMEKEVLGTLPSLRRRLHNRRLGQGGDN
jgi:ligand-binding sensor protein